MTEIHFASREEWLALRRKYVGASEVAALFGCQPNYAMSHWTLWQVKAGRMAEPDVTGDRPEAGLIYEPATAEKAARMLNLDARKAGYWVHQTVNGMGATPDRLCRAMRGGIASEWLEERGIHPDAIGNLECKMVNGIEYKRSWGIEPPYHILLQDQHQKACTGAEWGVIFACIGGSTWVHWFTGRRPIIIKAIEDHVTDFWLSIEEGREPPIDGSNSTSAALRTLYSTDDSDDEPVDLSEDNELPELCRNHLMLSALRAQYAAAEQESRNGILAKLKKHRAAWCNGFTIKATLIKSTPDRVITESNIGTVIPGRSAWRRLTVREVQNNG